MTTNKDKDDVSEKEKEPLNSRENNKEKVEEASTLYDKVLHIKKNITVEPIIACFIIPSVIASLATQNLNLDKACRVNMNYTDEICDALKRKDTHNYTNQEMEVQKLIASIQVWKNIIQTSVPTILIIFMGAWSDKTGKRKICILLPIVGEILTCTSNLLNTYFFYEIPVQVTMFLEDIFPAITGGWTTMFLGVFSYISDVTTKENRTFRVGLVNLCMTAGLPVGTALSGVLIKYVGFYGVFSISAFLYILSFLYGLYVLKEPVRPQGCSTTGKDVGFLKCFFDLSHVKDTLTIAFKKGKNNRRIKIIMVLTVVAIVYGPNHGESSVMYLYTRFRFNWDAVMYSMYSTFSIITHSCGALFSISVFSRRMKFDDSVLGLISICSKFFGSLMKALARNDMQIYMVPIVEILNATTFTSLRSIASKLVTSEELGKINSLLSLVETLAAMIYDPLYSWMYMRTIHYIPGAVFLFSAGMTVPSASIFLWLFIQHRRDTRKSNQINEKELIETALTNIVEPT